MNREAIEAQLKAMMDEAHPKNANKNAPQNQAPRAHPDKALMAALIVGGAIFGALVMGIFQPAPVPPSAVADLAKTVEGSQGKSEIETVLFYMGVARIRN